MCGIAGIVGRNAEQFIEQMTQTLLHRGPDGHGIHVAGQVALGHRRLAVVDLSADGAQPMHSADSSLVVVFNGEIYNYGSLRRELGQRGHVSRSQSDTESILHAYAEWGTECLQHLEGMFAFVIYDKRRELLFGARDRFGEKPLYYVAGDGADVTFAFASELKALQACEPIARTLQLSPAGLRSFLLNDYVSGSQSIYTQVSRLEPGHAFTVDLKTGAPQTVRSWRYFAHPSFALPPVPVTDEREAGRVLSERLQHAVTTRMVSDVPLGIFLSGGVDSSAIAAIASSTGDPKEVHTFSMAFREPAFDESMHARRVSTFLGTTHHERLFGVQDCLQMIDPVFSSLDEPFADPSILPTALLCSFARESVTVALGGDGGDELFAGYDPFRAVRIANTLNPVLKHIPRRLGALAVGMLPSSGRKHLSLQFKAERFWRGARLPEALRGPTWMGPFAREELPLLCPGYFDDEQIGEPFTAQRVAGEALLSATHDSVAALLDFYQRFYLPDDILVKADRSSMMSSLEVRAPFLDTSLVTFANGLPSSLKFHQGTTKYLLKKMLVGGVGGREWLPRDIVYRSKKGFGIPVSEWIRGALRDRFKTLFSTEWPSSLSMVSATYREKLLREHLEGRHDHYKPLWSLFALGTWAQYRNN